ncbi:hypothetical protein [Nostoc sp.]
MEQLQRYLEVSDEQVLGAASLEMLSPVTRSVIKIDTGEKLEIDVNSLY